MIEVRAGSLILGYFSQFTQLVFLYNPGVVLSIVGRALPYQSPIKKLSHRLTYRKI